MILSMKGSVVMKIISRILSIITAGILSIICSLTAFADAPYNDAVIITETGNYTANIVCDDDWILVYENEHGKFGDYVIRRYDFSMNYTVFKSDTEITPEYFGLSDDSILLKTESTSSTETYSVLVETQEELEKLYEAAGKLVENEVIINGFKQFMYNYACFYGPGTAHITLSQADENFNPNSIEGLENITFKQNKSDSRIYYCDFTIENYIILKNAEETIRATENVEDFCFSPSICAVAHTPNIIRIFVDEYNENTTEAVIGDANNDTALNVRDCSYIARKIAYGAPQEISDAADFNADGKINIRDAAAIAGYLVSLYNNN